MTRKRSLYHRAHALAALAVLILALVFAGAPGASADVSGDWEYKVSGNTCVITKYRGSGGPAVIPAKIGNRSVTGIGQAIFFDRPGVTDLTIQEGVTTIDKGAFYMCRSMTSVKLPSTITSIGEMAFFNCQSLVSVTIPAKVKTIGEDAFTECNALEEILVDEANPNYVSENGILFDKAKKVLIHCPAKITGSYAIPGTVTSIAGNAFKGCEGLTGVTIPEGVTAIGYGAFVSSGIEEITLPGTVKTIGDRAFMGTPLCNVTIRNGLTDIGENAFIHCYSLVSITLPESVRSIGVQAFADCSRLEEIVVSPGNAAFASVDGVLFDKAGKTLIQYPPGREGDYVMPDGVTKIADNALWYCGGLTSVTIPEGVTHIGSEAFYGCSSLTSVTLPGSLTSMGEYAFAWTKKLTSVTIRKGAAYIGESAFSACSALETITVPDSVKSIGEGAFDWCDSLTVYCSSASYAARYAADKDLRVRYYDRADAMLVLPAGLKAIEEEAFAGAAAELIVVPEGVREIGARAFKGCGRLAMISLPDSVTVIAEDAFEGCGAVMFVCASDNRAAEWARAHGIAYILC